MSSPGAGKTALLEHTLERMRGKPRLGVLEGDVQTTLDADRLARFHIPLVQINTDPGFGGECHLDANMVRSGLSELPLDDVDVLIIENVGNLVCPAEFKVGEDTDRKSTRLNSSHANISYAVFCLKKKKTKT